MQKHHLDTSGLKCPLPVIKLQQLIRTLEVGDQVEMISTDKGAEKDVQSWCRINKHSCLEITKSDDKLTFLIQKN